MNLYANELRIGNYLRWDDPSHDILKVESISYSTNNWFVNNGLLIDMKPIPLTEEWLVRFGFDISEDKNIHNLKKAVIDGFRVNTYFDEEVEYWWLGYYHNKKQQKLKYVHQLQNLYFALTGEELELK